MGKFAAIKALDKDIFSAADAREAGVSLRMLHYLCNQGKVTRLSRGIYDIRDGVDLSIEALIRDALIQIGHSVVCLRTALQLYDLIEEVPEYIDFFSVRGQVSKRKIDYVKIHSIRQPLSKLATNRLSGFLVTTLEQTIVDLLRFNSSPAYVLEAIQEAKHKGIAIQISDLRKQAEIFRAAGKTKQLIESIF